MADELPVWAAQVTGAPLPPEAGIYWPEPRSEVPELYHAVLLAGRSVEVDAQTAAITAAIALDAHRISEQLHPPAQPAPPPHLSWQTLFQQ